MTQCKNYIYKLESNEKLIKAFSNDEKSLEKLRMKNFFNASLLQNTINFRNSPTKNGVKNVNTKNKEGRVNQTAIRMNNNGNLTSTLINICKIDEENSIRISELRNKRKNM